VLEAARELKSVKAIVNVTTDKCYENREWVWGYRENEPLGGHDPYSSSKACSELVASAYRRSFFSASGAAVASARAGNVVGGGDWATDRLVPDVLRAFEHGESALIRNPAAVRPWQHVLEPLSGYLTLAQRLVQDGHGFAEAWNFGPEDRDVQPVEWIVRQLAAAWGEGARWHPDSASHPHEASLLKLDISKAVQRMAWHPRWSLQTALRLTTNWQRAWLAGVDMHRACLEQITEYTHSR
jgi:CDP-glucose 4,6-dehydratase